MRGSEMNSALRYLLARSLLNGLLVRLRRLRQPKYLLGALIGCAYFYFYFYRFLFRGGAPTGMHGPSLVPDVFWPEVGAAILLVTTLILSWVLPASRAAVGFTEAEIAFLFSAPISRRTLIIHKLLKSQFALLIISVLFTFITGRFRAGSEAWFRMGAWWIILNTLSMHRIGASFALQRLRERGMADWSRRAAALFALAALVVLAEMTRRSLPALPSGGPDIAGFFAQLTHTGPLPYVLAPFKWVVAPYFAHSAHTFLATLAPALGIMALHFLWVIRADVSFEEASIAAAQKRAAFLTAHRKGEMRVIGKSEKAKTPLWRLRPTGFAPLAFLWKSLIKFGGRRTFGFWAAFFAILGAGAWYVHESIGHELPGPLAVTAAIVGIGCYITVLLSLVIVGQNATAQLRQGMAAMDLLKTYPIPGWQLALGELLGPLVLGTLLQWAALGIGAVLAASLLAKIHGAQLIITLSACALGVVLPALNVSMSILPSAAALYFPGWFRPQEAAAPGIENTGLRLIVGISQFLAIAAALLPALFFAGCAWFAVGKWAPDFQWQAIATIGTAAVVLALEVALGIAWLGDLYDHYDGSSE